MRRMSKRTDSINKSLDNLNELQRNLDDFIASNKDLELKSLENISFQFKQELKTLNFWIDSLYKYNGKSTSIVKQNSSMENGRKGGRPPKEVSQAKKDILWVEGELIPDLDHKILMADSNEELADFKNQREKAFDKLVKAKGIVRNWQEKQKEKIDLSAK